MKTVEILLSTYNGEEFLETQLSSLLVQDYSNISVTIRDDGSTDNTTNIIKECCSCHENFKYSFGENVGVINSFFDLLQDASNADYYMFCDQDDYWKEDKVSRAVTILNEYPEHIPLLYCSQTELVASNENGEFTVMGHWPRLPNKPLSVSNALVENVAVGCTIMMNSLARDLILTRIPNYSKIIMHDWWVYLCVSAFGKVVFDDKASILYRQHANNTVGVERNIIKKWYTRYKRFSNKGKLQLLRKQAIEFWNLYGERLPQRERQVVLQFFENDRGLINRIKFALKGEVYRHTFIENLILKIVIILKKI